MKTATLALLALSALAAQAFFTPADSARPREQCHILVDFGSDDPNRMNIRMLAEDQECFGRFREAAQIARNRIWTKP